jgi:hypothetical protein
MGQLVPPLRDGGVYQARERSHVSQTAGESAAGGGGAGGGVGRDHGFAVRAAGRGEGGEDAVMIERERAWVGVCCVLCERERHTQEREEVIRGDGERASVCV